MYLNKTEPVSYTHLLAVGLARQNELLVFLVHLDLGAAGDAAAAHAASHDGSVRGHAAPDGEDALGGHHALAVLGGSIQTNQNHLFAPVSPGPVSYTHRLPGDAKELKCVKDVVVKAADAEIAAAGAELHYEVGTMIEIPRACLTADEIAKEAEFFCFGTNDLTQDVYKRQLKLI